MSMTNAIKVRRAAKNDRMEAMRVTVTWLEKENNSAMKVTAVAERGERVSKEMVSSGQTHQQGELPVHESKHY